MPEGETEALLSDVRDYFGSHKFKGFPSEGEKKVVYESYWSKSQVKVRRSFCSRHNRHWLRNAPKQARSHPNMLIAQTWMNQQYKADPSQRSESLRRSCSKQYDLIQKLTLCVAQSISPLL
jgi:hypothetical protein